jgi:hypothetical protein
MKFTTSMVTVKGTDDSEWSSEALLLRGEAYKNMTSKEYEKYLDRLIKMGNNVHLEDKEKSAGILPPYVITAMKLKDTDTLRGWLNRRGGDHNLTEMWRPVIEGAFLR